MLNISDSFNSSLPLLSSSAQSSIDRAWALDTGLALDVLIEQAGMAVADAVKNTLAVQEIDYSEALVLIVGGKGNNGADAWVCARHLLADGINVLCYQIDEEAGENAHTQLTALASMQVEFLTRERLEQLETPDIIVDGMIGTGFSRARELPADLMNIFSLLQEWQQDHSYLIAIDIPSGIEADTGAIGSTCISADLTITFMAPKIGLVAAPGCTYAGEIVVAPLSISNEHMLRILALNDELASLPYLVDKNAVQKLRPFRPADGHKGTFGRALLVGGNVGMVGSIALAGQAAARSGAGLITLAVGPAAFLPVLSAFPEGLTYDIGQCDEAASCLKEYSQKMQVIAVGPGLGRTNWLADYIEWLLDFPAQLVFDADALNDIAANPERFQALFMARYEKELSLPILTPHPGEFKRLAPELAGLLEQDRQKAALALAKKLFCVIVLKGAASVIAMPDGRIYINSSGNDGMAKGGSGDCLTGIITGLAAQGLSPEAASISGVYLHGLAGDLAADSFGQTAILPQDLLHHLGKAWLQTGWLGQKKRIKR